jgi:glutamine amidotransferase
VKVAVIDYNMGNLASVMQGLKEAGLEPVLTRGREMILSAQAVVLPGVGAFAKGMENLEKYRLISTIYEVCERGTPFLGICLGMQLLFEESEEHGLQQGLGLMQGRIVRFPPGQKVPHMGWNTLKVRDPHPYLKGIPSGSYVYFVHSYYATECDFRNIMATTNYGVEFPAMVCLNNIVGVQFHPEKSNRVGLKLLKNFGEMVRDGGYTGY